MVLNTNKIKNSRSNSDFFHLLLTIFIVLWMNGGILTFFNDMFGFKYIKIALFLLWGLMAMSRDKKFFSRYLKFISPLSMFLVIICFEKILAYEEYDKYVNIIISNIIYLLIITALFVFHCNNSYKKEKKVIIFAFIIDVIICGIITIIQLENEPTLSRVLATADPTIYMGRDILPKGILSYGNAYSFVFFVFALSVYMTKDYKMNKISTVLMILFVFFLILEMQFALSFIMIILALILAWGIRRFQKGYGVFVLFLFPILLGVFYSYSEQIVDLLIRLVGDNFELSARLEEIKAFLLQENLSGSDLMTRFEKYTNSFEAIFSNYFIGALLMGKGTIGGHSELLDCLAKYGCLPFLCMMVYFKSIYNQCKKVLDNSLHSYLKMVFFLFVLLSFVNTSLWSPIMLVLIFIVPLLYLNVSDKNEENLDNGKDLCLKR